MAPIADLLADAGSYSISPPRRVRQPAPTVGSLAAHRFSGVVAGRRGRYRSCRPRSTADRLAEPQGLAGGGEAGWGHFLFRGIFLFRIGACAEGHARVAPPNFNLSSSR